MSPSVWTMRKSGQSSCRNVAARSICVGRRRPSSRSDPRAPNHVPEVMRAIERLVRAADPFPPPKLIGGLTYTDTWLWHKSGKWQLDTLTEGQD